MFQIGCHLSSAQGFRRMGAEALRIGANVVQFFSRNPRGGAARSPDPADAAALRDLARAGRFGPLMVHAPYTLNLCAKDPKVRDFALSVLREDLTALETGVLPGDLYVLHPGNHMGRGSETGIALIAQSLNAVLLPDQTTRVLLETMSGKGTEVGARFEELREILDRVDCKNRVGVCLDTCHVYAAGYDIVHDPDTVLERFDTVVGLGRLYAVHLQDSLTPLASRKDRHARIGEGRMGVDAVVRIINHPVLRGLPFCLETPNDPPGHAREIKLLREARH